MIEVTDEMIRAAQAATCRAESDGCMEEALTAVLAIVERDHPEIERARQEDLEAGWSEMHAQRQHDEEPF